MAVRKLTKVIVDAVRPTSLDQFVWDTVCRGFGVKVTPRGHKTYLFQYRTPRNKSRRLTLGRVVELSIDDARDQALRAAQKVRDGFDPAEERIERGRQTEREKEDNAVTRRTVAELVEAWKAGYLDKAALSKSGRANALSNCKLIVAAFGSREHTALKRADVIAWHSAQRARPSGANKIVKRFNQVWAWCEVNDQLAPEATTAKRLFGDFDKWKEVKRGRRLSETEYASLFRAIDRHRERGDIPEVYLDATELLMLTGLRRGEALSLMWEASPAANYVDLDAGELIIQRHKTWKASGTKYIAISTEVATLLRRLESRGAVSSSRLECRASPWLFPSPLGGQVKSLNGSFEKLAKTAGLSDAMAKDLRTSFISTGIVAAGIGLETMAKAVGHADEATTSGYYVKVSRAERAGVMAKTAAAIAALRG